MNQRFQLPDIPEAEQTPLVKSLLALLEQFAERLQQQDEEIAYLKDEINILKGEKKRPQFKPSKMDKKTNDDDDDEPKGTAPKKRPGSSKRSKKKTLKIHQTKVIQPNETIPEGSRFKGYRDFVVQDLVIDTHNTHYKLARWQTPDGSYLTGQLPANLRKRHFGSQLISYVLYQHHHCQTTQPLLLEQLREWGVDISAGQIENLLTSNQDIFHHEKDDLLQAGLKASSYITVDDSGARHKGKNGFVTQMGNELFAWFSSTQSKNRINFLELLRAGKQDYVLTEAAILYMRKQRLPKVSLDKLQGHLTHTFRDQKSWQAFLTKLSFTNKRHQRIATEGALLGSVLQYGMCDDLVIVSDDAGQFNVLLHGLCWIHTERLIHKLLPLNENHREALNRVREQIWDLYRALKVYKLAPEPLEKQKLDHQFDEIFTQQTSFATLNQALMRINKNKAELLLVLERPEIPLHTNGSETDIRDYVKKRKVSGGTRSDEGRRCRDTFISLKKTCRKLKISFWKYLKTRLEVDESEVEYLPDLIMARATIKG